MAFDKTEFIWMNGKFVKWDDAKIHVLSHVVHYGSSIFEGQRAYKTDSGSACFRLEDHVTRLFNSCKIYRMEFNHTPEEITQAILNLIAMNKLEECYIRPVAYRGYENLGVDPSNCPVDVAIGVWPWGAYLGADALEKGVAACISSWTRFAPNTFPAMAKSGANYMNSQLIKMEAMRLGFAEGIALDAQGFVSEGSAQNIFMVRNGEIYTPPLSASILPGLTRDSVITIARDMGYTVREENIPREALYIAEEAFFTGSAVEVSPISSIDRIKVGSGKRGPITKKLQDAFFEVVHGRTDDKYNWLTPVPQPDEVPAP